MAAGCIHWVFALHVTTIQTARFVNNHLYGVSIRLQFAAIHLPFKEPGGEIVRLLQFKT